MLPHFVIVEFCILKDKEGSFLTYSTKYNSVVIFLVHKELKVI